MKNVLPHIKVSDIHGPVFTQLDDGAPLSRLGLRNPFIHLVSLNQIDNICGFSAVANAYALEQQLNKQKPISSDTTREFAEKVFTDKIKEHSAFEKLRNDDGGVDYADAQTIIQVATKLGLEKGTLEFLDRDTVKFLHEGLKEGKSIDRNAELCNKLLNNPVTHIIYNVGGAHWVLLSVVTEKEVSTLYLLNSSNAPLQQGDDVAQLLRYISELTNEEFYTGVAEYKKNMEALDGWLAHDISATPAVLKKYLQDHGDCFSTDAKEQEIFIKRIINTTDGEGNTLLHKLASQGLTYGNKLYTYLIGIGVDRTSKNKAGYTFSSLAQAYKSAHVNNIQKDRGSFPLSNMFLVYSAVAVIIGYFMRNYQNSKQQADKDTIKPDVVNNRRQ